ncbi:hypothetical protein [Dendrosporobacter sp. 1207_IL3150]|uniref:hypothetical protein n=1 Tax=Dendrosporobacter sp. 1207_IL3150 TaxID=3084054 RepID=UPI002FDB7DB2
MNIVSDKIIQRAKELGADLCGIASIERFTDAPLGFHPTDVLKDCKSVIVLAARFPLSTLSTPSPAAYTFVRHRLVDKIDTITFQLSSELENIGACAVPIPSSDPYDYWDETRKHGQGILSLKHAAVRAGLGKLGKNTLLINDKYGNMIWLGGIVIDIELAPSSFADYQACIQDCHICLDACPSKALDGITIIQSKCRSISGKCTDGGGFVYACNLCRKLCPNHKGIL